jgi:hypothetical protein
MYLRTSLTERQLAVLFDVFQKQVDRVLHDLLASPGELPGKAPSDQRELWIVDGTLIPTRDHTRTALCNNYRRSTNVQGWDVEGVTSPRRGTDGRIVRDET